MKRRIANKILRAVRDSLLRYGWSKETYARALDRADRKTRKDFSLFYLPEKRRAFFEGLKNDRPRHDSP